MRVAIVTGIVVPNDAISAAAAEQGRLLQTLPGVTSVTIFAHFISREIACAGRNVADAWALVADDEFARCDVVIFHWGIHYDLFDAITLIAASTGRRAVVHFHNCTPAELVSEKDRPLIERSIRQVSHAIGLGVGLWTYSEFNRRTLLEWGADERDIAFVPFPIDAPAGLAAVRSTETVDLVSVGRFVPAKGQHTLVDALALLDPDLRHAIRVRFAGSATFSDPSYYGLLRTRIHQLGLSEAVTIVDDPSDEELWELYANCHIVVSTSLHEGLCVPIIEGYSVGCRSIGTTAGNLPFVVVSPDEVVPPGDAAALADAIERTVGRLASVDADYDRRRTELVRSFSTASCREHLLEHLFR